MNLFYDKDHNDMDIAKDTDLDADIDTDIGAMIE